MEVAYASSDSFVRGDLAAKSASAEPAARCGGARRPCDGFSHEKTAHHFLLYPNGGEINVSANEAIDKGSIDQIRIHLGHISKMFAAGNFKAPMLIHDTNPPGVPAMIRLKETIKYDYFETEHGARIRLSTDNSQAIDAIHAFLLFQIIDHQTGDSPSIASDTRK
jgi:hypothetical protein